MPRARPGRGARRTPWRPRSRRRSRTRPRASGHAVPTPSANRWRTQWTNSWQAATRERSIARDPLCELQRRRTDLVGCHHRVDEPDLVGPLGRDRHAGHGHLQGHPSGIRRPIAVPPPPGNRPRRTSGQAELGRGRGDDQVAPQQQLEPTRHRGGVGGADEGNGHLAVDQPVVGGEGLGCDGGHRLAVGERPEVHPGGEGPVTGARQHHRAHIGIRLGRNERSAERLEQRTVERVA